MEISAILRNLKDARKLVPIITPFTFPALPLQNPDRGWRMSIYRVASVGTAMLDVALMQSSSEDSGMWCAAADWVNSFFSPQIKKQFATMFLSSFAPGIC